MIKSDTELCRLPSDHKGRVRKKKSQMVYKRFISPNKNFCKIAWYSVKSDFACRSSACVHSKLQKLCSHNCYLNNSFTGYSISNSKLIFQENDCHLGKQLNISSVGKIHLMKGAALVSPHRKLLTANNHSDYKYGASNCPGAYMTQHG